MHSPIHRNQLSITSFERTMIYLVCRLRPMNDVIMLYNTLLYIYIQIFQQVGYVGKQNLTFHFFSKFLTYSLTSHQFSLLIAHRASSQ